MRISFRDGTWVNDWIPTSGGEIRWLKTGRTWTATIDSVRIAMVGAETIGGPLCLSIVGWTWGARGESFVRVSDLDDATIRIRRVLRQVSSECRALLGRESFADGEDPLQ